MIELLEGAVAEDCPHGDVTVDFMKIPSRLVPFEIVAKEEGLIVGAWLWPLAHAMRSEEASVEFKKLASDGDWVRPGTCILSGRGDWAWIMKWERSILNLMGYLSGIASGTHRIVTRVRSVNRDVHVSETRKILPLYRAVSKYAVTCGGGSNHRATLSDAILIKENHIRAKGGIETALRYLEEELSRSGPSIEIEIGSPAELDVFLKTFKKGIPHRIEWILLDNFTPAEAQHALQKISGLKVELSGGINSENLLSYASLPIHRISLGALTHSVKNFDLSLLVREETI